MNAGAILLEATRRGLTLRAQGDRIRFSPTAAMTAEIASAVVAARAELLAILHHAVPPPSSPCWNCRGARFFARPERMTWICARCHPPIAPDEMVWHEVAAQGERGALQVQARDALNRKQDAGS